MHRTIAIFPSTDMPPFFFFLALEDAFPEDGRLFPFLPLFALPPEDDALIADCLRDLPIVAACGALFAIIYPFPVYHPYPKVYLFNRHYL